MYRLIMLFRRHPYRLSGYCKGKHRVVRLAGCNAGITLCCKSTKLKELLRICVSYIYGRTNLWPVPIASLFFLKYTPTEA